jgi:peptidoglycan/LPS O-acetylase OafA/YrhL
MTIRVGLQSTVVVPTGGHDMTYYDEGDITWQGVIYRIASARPDMIVYGCLLAFVNRAIPRPLTDAFRKRIAIAGAVGWVAYLGFIVFGERVPGLELFGGVGYQVALLLLGPQILDLYLRQESRASRFFAHPTLRWLGVRSYGIYLWHIPVLLPFLPLISDSYGMRRLVVGLVGAAAGVGAGILSFRFIERPFLRLKDTRYRRPQDRTAAERPLS